MTLLTPYDAYEIHPVIRLRGKDGQPCLEITQDPAAADLWSLYGHIPGEGLDGIGDFTCFEDAARVYARITGHAGGEKAPVDTGRRLAEALTLALCALNQAPSFRVRHARYTSSYQVCAALEAVLREVRGSP